MQCFGIPFKPLGVRKMAKTVSYIVTLHVLHAVAHVRLDKAAHLALVRCYRIHLKCLATLAFKGVRQFTCIKRKLKLHFELGPQEAKCRKRLLMTFVTPEQDR